MEESLITKKDIEEVVASFGITKGDVLCLQADFSKTENVLNSYRSLIEALQEVVSEQGCIFIPSFTFSTLDPAVRDSEDYEQKDWSLIREHILGYQSKYTISQVYDDLNNQFHSYKVTRSTHPVYSFTYWGNFQQEYVKQQMNYPISFSNALKAFTKGRAFNLLIGEKMENSVLVPAIAQTMNLGVTEIQRAYVSRNNKNTLKSYLNLKVDLEECRSILDMCIVEHQNINGLEVHCISIQR